MRERLKSAWSDRSRRPALIFGFAAVGVAVILLILASSQLIPARPPAPTPTPDTGCTINCGVGGQVSPVVPKTLRIRDHTYDVTPVTVPRGDWTASATGDSAEWIYGTLVNYVMGLPGTQANKDLLQAVGQNDKVTIELSNGQTLEFQFAGRQFVSPQDKDVFAQQRPGLTMALLGENTDQRLVVTANYVVESETGKTVPSNVVAIRTPNGRLDENAPGIPVGSAFYLVDFTTENIGTDPIDAANFQVELQDFAGQKYKPSDTASQLGPNSPLRGQILPGISATFTSGFEVPSNITGPILTWSFKPDASFKRQANVAVPLVGPTPTPDPRTRATVQISQAYLSPDQTELIIVGGIGNPTNSLIVVTPADISLSTPEGALATLLSSEPAMPWRLGPGDNLSFTLHFSHLPTATAILKILLNSFELTFH